MQFVCIFPYLAYLQNICRKFEFLISQGSVATCLRWGGFISFSAVQKFWKSINIWQSYREFKGGNFFETQCIYCARTVLLEIVISLVYFSIKLSDRAMIAPLLVHVETCAGDLGACGQAVVGRWLHVSRAQVRTELCHHVQCQYARRTQRRSTSSSTQTRSPTAVCTYRCRLITWAYVPDAVLARLTFTARRKASFTRAVYGTAYPAVCLSVRHTSVLCQNEGTQRVRFSPSGSPMSLVFDAKNGR